MSKSSVIQGSDNAEDAAKALELKAAPGYEVVVAEPDELQIDYDIPYPGDAWETLPESFKIVFKVLRENGMVRYFRRYKSKSGNLHVLVKLSDELPEVERVALQAAFGSDPLRETLNLIAIRKQVKNPILLFMRKDRNAEPEMLEEPPKDTAGRKFRDE